MDQAKSADRPRLFNDLKCIRLSPRLDPISRPACCRRRANWSGIEAIRLESLSGDSSTVSANPAPRISRRKRCRPFQQRHPTIGASSC